MLSERAKMCIQHSYFEAFISIVILCNCVQLILSDPKSSSNGVLEIVEIFFLFIYIVEMLLKMLGLGLFMRRSSYFRNSWNILDFCIVVASVASFITNNSNGGSNRSKQSINFSSLRTFRVLRPLRTINVIRKLRALVKTVMDSLPYLFDIFIIILFTFGVFAIIGLQLFRGALQKRCFHLATGKVSDDSPACGTNMYSCDEGFECGKIGVNPTSGLFSFDNILESYMSVFIVTTMEGWSPINGLLIKSSSWFSIIYFLCIIFIEAFFLINLALAIISAKFNEAQEEKTNDEMKKIRNLPGRLKSTSQMTTSTQSISAKLTSKEVATAIPMESLWLKCCC